MANFKNKKIAWEKVNYPIIKECTGNLGVVEYGSQIDFEIKRIFYLSEIPENCSRGYHSHKELKQLILCLAGSFSLVLDSGIDTETILMKPSESAVFVDGRVWREMRNFSDDAVMLVLCDREYRFDEVVRSYNQFKQNLEIEDLI
ncbi:FdtA/QdtA family cupin domain-containing protein [Shewanella xiamenensis]|uniref:sugar 3,4-ketoisomerase n=1 Tax=Shewanella xiamenensis TaxID=332186 RepID=UPI00313C4F5A